MNFPNVLNYSGPGGITSWREDYSGERAQSSQAEAETWSLQDGGKLPGALRSLAKWQELLSAQSFTFLAAHTFNGCFSFLLLQDIPKVGGKNDQKQMKCSS